MEDLEFNLNINDILDKLWNQSSNAKTQKARGLLHFRTSKLYEQFKVNDISTITNSRRFFVILDDDTVKQLIDNKFIERLSFAYNPIFARPCPMTSQHGFVDSRKIRTSNDLQQIWNETRAADPQGELIICQKYTAENNYILTPNRCTIGKDHDGATSGKNTVAYPLIDNWTKDLPVSAGIINTPYMELIRTSNSVLVTQLRDGPAIPPNAIDFIPAEITVQNILRVDGQDLQQWQRLIETIDKTTTVVYHAGGDLACHYAVHCVLNDVTYITSFEPIVGSTYQPIAITNQLDYNAVLSGLQLALSKDLDNFLKQPNFYAVRDYAKCISSMLYILHNFTALGRPESRFFGFVLGLTLRCCIAACLGELRHYRGICGEKIRSVVYKTYVSNLAKALDKIKIAHNVFVNGSWASGYGGSSWAKCAKQTILFNNAIVKFLRKPSSHSLKRIVQQLNILVNTAHNNGNFLNKFVSTSNFDQAAKYQAQYFLLHYPEIQSMREVEQLFPAETSYTPARNRLIRFKPTKEEQLILNDIFNHQPENDSDNQCEECSQELCSDCGECHNCNS